MSLSQKWPLSQDANKKKGICSVCRAVRQLKDKDGTVHRHGPRNNPCPGSDIAPLNGVGTTPSCSSNSASVNTCDPPVSNASTDFQQPDNTSPMSLLKLFLESAVSSQPLVKHIPRSARSSCATHLSETLRAVSSNPDDLSAWIALLFWGRLTIGNPKRGGKRHNLGTLIKKRISSFSVSNVNQSDLSLNMPDRKKSFSLADAVAAKLEEGNIRAAVRLISSEDSPSSFNESTFQALQDKHPSAYQDRKTLPDPLSTTALIVEEADVKKAILSFPAGSSGGLDGLRPQHLRDLVNCLESGSELVSSLTAFVNMLLSGVCHAEMIPILFGGRLVALNKKDGGVRPIAVGNTLRRLAAKCANSYAAAKLAPLFSPRQLGVGIAGGCEAAVHSVRRFLTHAAPDDILVKLDFSNAFNSIRRDAMLAAVVSNIPELYCFCHLSYSTHSFLKFGTYTIMSEEGAQQGDPLGPLLFCITIHDLLSSLSSDLSLAYLDDFSLGGSQASVVKDVDLIADEGAKLGLHLNVKKCELIGRHRISSGRLADFTFTERDKVVLLGAPLFQGEALDDALVAACQTLSTAIGRLKSVAAHDALILLRSSFSAPKVNHIIRCSPCFGHPSLSTFDSLLRQGLSAIINCDLTDNQWLQASLPVRDGGLGIRCIASLASSAFLASAASTRQLQDQILSEISNDACDSYIELALIDWSSRSHKEPILPDLSSQQRAWDRLVIDVNKNLLWNSYSDQLNLARLTAVSAPHSGDWLFALPITSCGLRLDDEAVRVSVGLRLGSNLCMAHKCPCGAEVDCTGIHGLSCRRACGRQSRHHAVNDLIWHAFGSAGIPATKEPVGLLRTDGKRPDGLSLIPWSHGKAICWDVTIVDPLASSYRNRTSSVPSGAAELAASRKIEKYVNLPASILFQPVAIECLGSLNQSAVEFINELGRKLTVSSGECRSTEFLFQRIGIAVQRFNAIAFRGSFDGFPADETD